MNDINGLPVGVLVVLLGVAAVVAAWLALRFGRVIALFLAGVGILVAVVLGVGALGTQAAANYQTATAAKEAVQVAQTANITNLALVGAVGCIGGVALVAVVGALGVAGYFWLKSRQVQKPPAMTTQPRPVGLPDGQPSPVVWVVGDGQPGGVNLENVDLSRWGW